MAKLCKNCGKLLSNEAGFCPYCGEKILGRSSSTPKSTPTPPPVLEEPPVYEAPPLYEEPVVKEEPPVPPKKDKKDKKKLTISEKTAKKAAKKKAKKNGKAIAILIICGLLLLLLGGGALMILDAMGIVDIPFIGATNSTDSTKETSPDIVLDTEIPAEYLPEYEDANAYYQANSQVLSVQDAATSTAVQTEAQAFQILIDRGFKDYPITASYSMAGEYSDPAEITSSSGSKHPRYTTYYVSPDQMVWTILLVDGDIMAYPVSYNTREGATVEVILSESESVTSYDGVTNQFFKTIPNGSEAVVKAISRIDAKTLENLDFGGIDAL